MKEAMKKKTTKVLNSPWFNIGLGAVSAVAATVMLTDSGIRILAAEQELGQKHAAKRAAKEAAEEAEAEME